VHFFGMLILFGMFLLAMQMMRFGSLTGFVVVNASIADDYAGYGDNTITSMATTEGFKEPSLGLAIAVLLGLVLLYLVVKYIMHHHTNVMSGVDHKKSGERKLIPLDLD